MKIADDDDVEEQPHEEEEDDDFVNELKTIHKRKMRMQQKLESFHASKAEKSDI